MPVSRRDLIGLTAATGSLFARSGHAQDGRKTLKIAKWAHFLGGYDEWFDEGVAADWGAKHDTQVLVDHVPAERIHALATAEIAAGGGHDIFMFPWPPAEFAGHVIDHAEIYQTITLKYGNLDRLAHGSTFDPRAKTYFASADYWIPQPVLYAEDCWGAIGMPLGPLSYDGLRVGAAHIRAEQGIPCGLALAPVLDGAATLHSLLFAFRGRILDPAGNVVLGKNYRNIEALKYVKALQVGAGPAEPYAWGPGSAARAMVEGRSSATINPISLLRQAEREAPERAKQIRLSPPLLGAAGIFAFPHAINCSAVLNQARNQEGAKQFLADLIDYSRAGYDKSGGCNFPIYQKTLPNLIVRLSNDPAADPPYKYKELKDMLHWTRNLGFPGFANPVEMEVFNSAVIPRMFRSVVRDGVSPEDAVAAAAAETTRIADKWKQA